MENPVELDAEEHSRGLSSPGHKEGDSTGEMVQGSRTAEDAADADLASSSKSPSSYADAVK